MCSFPAVVFARAPFPPRRNFSPEFSEIYPRIFPWIFPIEFSATVPAVTAEFRARFSVAFADPIVCEKDRGKKKTENKNEFSERAQKI